MRRRARRSNRRVWRERAGCESLRQRRPKTPTESTGVESARTDRVDIRQTSADHNDLGVEHVDDRGERASRARHKSFERCHGHSNRHSLRESTISGTDSLRP